MQADRKTGIFGMNGNSPPDGETPAARLLAWYDQNRRVLPWRESPTPYHVWISEIMLQQTRVEAVRAYYARFLARFPDIPSLAAADEGEVLKCWEGLGYYSRGRNLHRAAQVLVEQYGGRMPAGREEIRRLPGIGAYTSAAIASIAFGERVPAVDGNLLRIFSRMSCCGEEIGNDRTKKLAEAYYLALMPEDRPGDFNQALMDLGSGICAARGVPDCGACPWQRDCLAKSAGRQLEFPVKAPKKARRAEKRTVLVIWRDGRILLRQRPGNGLLAGLWELPNLTGILSEAEVRKACFALGLELGRITPLGEAKHVFTHLEWQMAGYEAAAVSDGGIAPEGGGILVWAAPEEIRDKYPVPSAFDAFRERISRPVYLE